MSNEVKVRFSSDGSEVEFFEVETLSLNYVDKNALLIHKNKTQTYIPTNNIDFIEIGNEVNIFYKSV